MQANHIAFGIMNKGKESVFADGRFLLEDTATIFGSTGGFHGAVLT